MENAGLYCQYCGELNEAQAQFCRKCGKAQVPVPPSAAAQTDFAQVQGTGQVSPVGPGMPGYLPPAPPAAASDFRGYAGFWIRFLALIIDSAVLSVVMIPLWIIFAGAVAAVGAHPPMGGEPDPRVVLAILPMLGVFGLAAIAINWLYEALMTSSSKQGTLGKMALGLKVTTKEGLRLSFMHATGRHFAKFINGIIMNIGYILAAFTERKQGLHDMIAGTYVIKTR